MILPSSPALTGMHLGFNFCILFFYTYLEPLDFFFMGFQKKFLLLLFFYFTILYWFCHTSTCICHGCTRVPHPEPNFLEESSSLSHFTVFLYFFALIAEEGFLISPCYSLELCIQIDISFLFSFAFRFPSFHSYL